jgi:MYXO-CTERM domain-containing protein
MKMSTATAIFALAASAAPAAVGQSQLPFRPLQPVAATVEMVQVSAKSVLPKSSSRSFDLDGNMRTSESSFGAPSPGVSWLMALGFLGLVAVRRTR